MAVKKILLISKHEKTLRSKSEPVLKINREIKALFQDLKDTMDHSGNAIGLAAPQLGVMKRVFAVRLGYKGGSADDDLEGTEEVIGTEGMGPEEASEIVDDDPPPPPPVIMMNPEIVETSDEMEKGYDGCLSIPGMMGFTYRHQRIRVKYIDEQGKPQDQWYEGWDARMIEHENDHLDGILFMDRLSTLDDLYVFVRDDDGEYHQVRYTEVVGNAKKAANDRTKPAPSR